MGLTGSNHPPLTSDCFDWLFQVAEKSGYGRSLFDRLQTLKHGCRHMLNIQYRMKPEISRFPNSQFYEGGVKDGANVLSQEYGVRLAGASRYAAYAFVNCGHGFEETVQKGWKNSQEVAVVIHMVQQLGKGTNSDPPK